MGMERKQVVRHVRRFREIEARLVVSAPYSIALDGIERYLEARGSVLDVEFPLRALGFNLGLVFGHRVLVRFDPRRRPVEVGRYDDRLVFSWKPDPPGPFPDFEGRLTILPYGTQSEFILKGQYDPPFGLLGRIFDAVAGKRIAAATAVSLLGKLRAVLEAEYATLEKVMFRIPDAL